MALQIVLDEVKRDTSKLSEIGARLQRDDPALFMELVEWIRSQQQ